MIIASILRIIYLLTVDVSGITCKCGRLLSWPSPHAELATDTITIPGIWTKRGNKPVNHLRLPPYAL